MMSVSFADLSSNPEIELYEDDTVKELKIEKEKFHIAVVGSVEINIT
ncbi:MAG: hypothetical protein U9Q80_01705 [Bacillota bacterium]|nr:hypothetical protein [Bacillota bacterium]